MSEACKRDREEQEPQSAQGFSASCKPPSPKAKCLHPNLLQALFIFRVLFTPGALGCT